MKSLIKLSCLIYICICSYHCKQAPQQQTPEEPAISFKDYDEARAYLQDQISKPLPANFQMPSYITSKYPLEQVYDTFKILWPEFYGKEYEEYLDAIMAHPGKVEGMLNHSKAIRRVYHEGSKY